ncbi:MAG: cytochrome-c peroxidase [Flavisolibacter sp.]|nr:cytochrome-c peroxidase [Flavisolibacter sp.]
MSILIVVIATGSALFNSCKKKDIAPLTTPLNFNIPYGFPQPVYSFSRNPVTAEGLELGRRLFYEGRLSKDGNYPCSSCHQQVAAFTTFDHDLSHGYNHSHTTRNAPALANIAWQPEYYWDGHSKSLEEISLAHITAPTEMAETIESVVNKLSGDTMYRRLSRAAYGSEQITSQRILNALSQFVINLVSANSRYDRMLKGEITFTIQEQAGYTFFQSKCATCHTEPLFTDNSYRNIGLPLDPFLKDYGRMKFTSNKSDSLKFRVPSLRNVLVSANYTHDGRIGTIRNMINHYRSGVVQSSTLDPLLVNGIPMTDLQMEQVVSFLRTLTDSSYLVNPRFSGQ